MTKPLPTADGRATALETNPFDGPPAARIVVDATFQIRKGNLKSAQVKRYADAMKAGQRFPAIKAMKVGGRLVLVDGFHRLAAAKYAGCEESLEVELVGEGNAAEALWYAFEANRQHGLPLKTRELRDGFKAYVRAKKNLTANKQLKSYREISKDLGVGHTTIRHWMRRFYPKMFHRMSNPNEGPISPGEGGILFPNMETMPMSSVDFVEQARTVAASHADDSEANWHLIASLEDFLRELRQRPANQPEF